MDVDTESAAPSTSAKPAKKEKGTPTATPSSAPSPKPARAAKDAPPPLPQGSGLITGALFGIDDSSNSSSKSTPDIILHVPLRGESNKIISFARMAEEKYGFAALHPRIAAQKERLARVAAASAALEKNEKGGKGTSAGESADEDLSVDVDRDSDADGDITMGGTGVNGVSSGAELGLTADGKKRRTRKKKIEDYDREDPFVDDSELAWQEQAAASKDGFFVYSGPLIPEGEKVQVERWALALCLMSDLFGLLITIARADGTIKRGRGRGRGTGRGRATTHHVPIASNIPISPDTGLPVRGPGSRGGSITRKPRANKAPRQQTEPDKQDLRMINVSHDGRGGRGGYSRGGGAPGSRGGKTASTASTMTGMVGLAPAPGPHLAPAPPGPHPGQGIIMR
jgi:hypothetical protein